MNGERGRGCASTILPLAMTPNSHNAPGLRWAAGVGEGLRAEQGWRRACPGHTARLLVSHLGHLLQLSPAPCCGLGCIKLRRSLLSPPRVLHEQRRGEEPLGQTATEPKTRRKRKRGRRGNQTIIKKKVTKGKNTNSLTEYKDLESDGATIASLERGGHGHAPPASSTIRFGAPGVQPSPCPGGEEEGWPRARTAQCSPHPRRGFGEGG